MLEFKDFLREDNIENEVEKFSYLIERFLEENENNKVTELITENNTQESQQWFDQLTAKINAPRKSTSKTSGFKNYRTTNAVMLGRVYAYKYDPKHRATLPFFDENPLVIPFAFKDGVGGKKGFLGINLHFLPRRDRKNVMQFFIKQDTESVMKSGEIPINYGMIKNNTRFALLKFCIRMYLLDHVRGMFYLVPQEDYIKVIDLYSGKYVGMSEHQIMMYIQQQKVNSIWRITKTSIKKREFKKAQSAAKGKANADLQQKANLAPVPHVETPEAKFKPATNIPVEKEPVKFDMPDTGKAVPKAKEEKPKFDVLPTAKNQKGTDIPKAKDITQNPDKEAPKFDTNLVTTKEPEKPKFDVLPNATKSPKKPKITGNIK